MRVSSEEQAREGISLDNQRHKIELYAELNGLKLIGIEADEGISAKNLNRPAMRRVLAMAKANQIDTIIIYSLSRAFRNTIDALKTSQMLDRKGIALHSISENLNSKSAIGKFFFHLTASLAEMESNVTSERTSDALNRLRESNLRYGEIPLGYNQVENNIVENEKEQMVIRYMHELRKKGMSYRKIAEKLTADGIKTKKGNEKWCYQVVRDVIRRTN